MRQFIDVTGKTEEEAINRALEQLKLDLQDPLELTTGFDRENLYFEVQQPADKRAALLELVKTRVSQINGCAFCLDMHSKDARAAGEDEQRLYLLAAWREAPCYTPRERAALAWAEAVTLLKDQEVGDAQYHAAREHFDDKALVDLTLAIVAINGWNRLSIAFRTPAGTYQPQHHS